MAIEIFWSVACLNVVVCVAHCDCFFLFKIFSKRKKEKKESCSISNAAKKNKSRSRINDGFLAWFFVKKTMTKNVRLGWVYGGCLLFFLCGFCAFACIAIFADFFFTLFFWICFCCGIINRNKLLHLYFCICISVFCITVICW